MLENMQLCWLLWIPEEGKINTLFLCSFLVLHLLSGRAGEMTRARCGNPDSEFQLGHTFDQWAKFSSISWLKLLGGGVVTGKIKALQAPKAWWSWVGRGSLLSHFNPWVPRCMGWVESWATDGVRAFHVFGKQRLFFSPVPYKVYTMAVLSEKLGQMREVLLQPPCHKFSLSLDCVWGGEWLWSVCVN